MCQSLARFGFSLSNIGALIICGCGTEVVISAITSPGKQYTNSAA